MKKIIWTRESAWAKYWKICYEIIDEHFESTWLIPTNKLIASKSWLSNDRVYRWLCYLTDRGLLEIKQTI